MSEAGDQLALVRRLKDQNDELASENVRLKSGGGGGTSDNMDGVDAKIAAAEARTDTKFETLRADLKDFATKGTVWQAAATIVALILAAIAFGGDRFDAGVGMADARQSQLQRDNDQDEAVGRIEAKIDQLIAGQGN